MFSGKVEDTFDEIARIGNATQLKPGYYDLPLISRMIFDINDPDVLSWVSGSIALLY